MHLQKCLPSLLKVAYPLFSLLEPCILLNASLNAFTWKAEEHDKENRITTAKKTQG